MIKNVEHRKLERMQLEVKDLAVGYGSKQDALHQNVSFQVQRGEFICLLGPNGAGKSTLIKTLSGFLKPVDGAVFYGGYSLKNLSEAKRAKMVSVVLTERISVPNLTVFELVSLGRTPYTGFFGKLTEEDVTKVNHAIEVVGLHDYLYKHLDRMSDGERQKAMIAKALVQETPFIILDEPTAFLDLPAKLEIMQLLARLSRDNNRGIFLSTHDLEMALQIADKICLLAKGRSMKIGMPEDLVLSNDFKSFFEREGVVFDNNSGTFKYHKEGLKPIVLKNKNPQNIWVERAMYRLGFEAVKSGSDYIIEVGENGTQDYRLFKYNELLIHCKSIQKLMEKVQECYQ